MEQTILQLPMQPIGESPPIQRSGIGVVYQQPLGNLVPVLPKQLGTMSNPLSIGRRRREILQALIDCQELTIDQLQRWLNLSPASIPYLREHLRVLEKGKFVEARPSSKQYFYGRPPHIYSYATEARKYLRGIGYPVPTRYRPLKERMHKEYPIHHTLAVNEVLLNARNLRWDVQDVYLADYRHEKVLNANPLIVPLPERVKPYRLSPDLWLSFSHPLWDFFACVELNLSEVSERDWRERVRAYLHSLKPYEERFHTRALVILTIIQSQIDYPKTNVTKLSPEEMVDRVEADANRRLRLTNMLKWTEAELSALNAAHLGNMFWFTDIRLHETTPKALFFGRQWQVPYQTGLYAPLPPGKGGGS